MLDVVRYKHHVPIAKVRNGMAYLRDHFQSAHPLAEYALKSVEGIDLIIREGNKGRNASCPF